MISIKDPKQIKIAKKKDKIIFIDMDGVVANWIEAACISCGIDINDEKVKQLLIDNRDHIDCLVDPDTLWKNIDKDGDNWWYNLEMVSWGKRLYEEMKSISKDVYFLSSPPRNPDSASGKVRWLQKHFGEKFNNYILTKHKHLCASPNSILIDDTPEKIKEFEEAGGDTFLWPSILKMKEDENLIEETFSKLKLQMV